MAVTHDDVARRAGVSPAVVSYVINSGPRPVSADARGGVLKAIAELGYRPDGLARSLRLGRSHAIGLVLPDTTNPFFAEMAQAVEDAAYATGYTVLICTTSDDVERERAHIVNLASRRVDGLILMSIDQIKTSAGSPDWGSPSSRWTDLRTTRPSRRSASTTPSNSSVPSISSSTDINESPSSQVQLRGRSLPLASQRVPKSDVRRRTVPGTGRRSGIRLRRRPPHGHALLTTYRPPPDALLISSDVQAIGVLSAAADLGLRVPEDLAVVSFDGTRAGAFRGSRHHVGRSANSHDGRTGGGPSARLR